MPKQPAIDRHVMIHRFPRLFMSTTATATIALVLLLVAVTSAAAVDAHPPMSPLPNRQPPPPAAVLLAPKTPMEFNQRGTYKAQNGDLEGAIADFDQAIQLKLDYVIAYYNRGTAHAQTGNARAALADYSQVILLKPNNAAARYTRGSLRASTGDKQGAIADFQQAAQLYKQQLNVPWQQKALNQLEQLQTVKWWQSKLPIAPLKSVGAMKPKPLMTLGDGL